MQVLRLVSVLAEARLQRADAQVYADYIYTVWMGVPLYIYTNSICTNSIYTVWIDAPFHTIFYSYQFQFCSLSIGSITHTVDAAYTAHTVHARRSAAATRRRTGVHSMYAYYSYY